MRRDYGDASLTFTDGPWLARLVRADNVLCPDGVRRTAYPSGDGIADTFFSIPARVRISEDGARFTISGYVTISDGRDTRTGEYRTEGDVRFVPYLYGRNGWRLASTDALAAYVRRAREYDRERIRYSERDSSVFTDKHNEQISDRVREVMSVPTEDRYPYFRDAQRALNMRPDFTDDRTICHHCDTPCTRVFRDGWIMVDPFTRHPHHCEGWN